MCVCARPRLVLSYMPDADAVPWAILTPTLPRYVCIWYLRSIYIYVVTPRLAISRFSEARDRDLAFDPLLSSSGSGLILLLYLVMALKDCVVRSRSCYYYRCRCECRVRCS